MLGQISMHNRISRRMIRRKGGFTNWLLASLFVATIVAGCSTNNNSAQAGGATSTAGPTADQQVNEALATSCGDCHSDHGSGPWNAKIAPSYLFGATKARKALDFSDWTDLDATQRHAAAVAIAAEIEDGSMPPGDYEFLHPSARLSPMQKRQVLEWTSQQAALPAH
jgi:Haem-binding domain